MFATDKEKLIANLCVKSACSPELAEELMADSENLHRDALWIATMANLGCSDEKIRETLQQINELGSSRAALLKVYGIRRWSRFISDFVELSESQFTQLDLDYQGLEHRINEAESNA